MKPPTKPRLPEELRTGKRKILEKDVEGEVCAYAVKHGWYHRKFSSPNHRAVPDQLMITSDDIVIFVEFKRPGEKPTPAQIREATRLQEKRQRVFCCDDIEKGKKLVDELTAGFCTFPQMPEVI
jgi:hypothetical protein